GNLTSRAAQVGERRHHSRSPLGASRALAPSKRHGLGPGHAQDLHSTTQGEEQMKSRLWRWTTLMGIGAFGVLLLSMGARPASAFSRCSDCGPGDDGGTPPPPPPAYTCQYDDATAPGVPSTGWGPALSVQRATQKTTLMPHFRLCRTCTGNAHVQGNS